MKLNRFVASIISVMLISTVCVAADVPTNVQLTADMDSITVTWTGDSEADSFNVYWGTESNQLDNKQNVLDTGDDTHTITGLDSKTTYFVAVSSIDNGLESSQSTARSVTTEGDTEAPATPTGLDVTAPDDITATSVSLEWNENTEDDFASYTLYYRTAANTVTNLSVDAETRTVTGLSAATRYFFSITAKDNDGNESVKSPELIVDTLVDVLPPFPPESVSAALSDSMTVTVKIQSGNTNMADFTGHILYYGQSPEQLDNQIDIGTALTHDFVGLPENTTWYFSATAYDFSGNESTRAEVASVIIEETETFLNRSDDEIDGGCFIGSLLKPEIYDVTENRNKIGISSGYYHPAESDFEDFYDHETYPVFLFYERGLFRYLSVDLKAGFLKESGNLRTVSGAPTEIDSDLTLVPVSASLNLNFPIIPYVWGFVGIGPDYWYYEEETDASGVDNDSSDWVGGYHGRTGLWLYNRDPDFKNWGGLIEVDYSRIDRFGDNKTDIGGWLFLLGLFYSF